jgi:hypothetical protein
MKPGSVIAVCCGLLFGGLFLFLPLGAFSILLVGAPAALVVLRWPVVGLSLFALAATFSPYSTLNIGFRFTVAEAMLGLTWAGIALHLFFQRLEKPQWGTVDRAMLLLMAFSALPFVIGQLMVPAEGNGPVNWIRWLANLSPLFMAPLLLATERDRDRLVVMLLLGNLAMLLISLAMFAKSRNAMDMIPLLESLRYVHGAALLDIFSAEHARLGTPWVHPNLTGGAMALFVPLATFYAYYQRGWRRALGASVAILGAVALLLSSSRGAILSMVVVLAWLSWLRVPGAKALLVSGILLGAVAAVSYSPLQARLATMFDADNASTEVRVDEYRRFPEAVARYPLGIGFKSEPPVPGSGLLGISNLWLYYMYKLGLLGMVLYIVVTTRWWREVAPRGKVLKVDERNGLWLGSTTAILAALLTGLIDHYYSFTMVLIALFWLIVGMGLQSAQAVPVSVSERPKSTLRKQG